jgi:hypothetical protein
MLPERVARLALAALIHDLPALVQQAGSAPPELQRVLALAAVADAAEHTLVRQAAAYAMPRSGAEPVLGRRLQPIFGLVGASAGTPPALTLPFSSLPAADQSHDRLFPTAAPGQRSLAEHLAAMLKALGQIAAEVDLANFEHSYAHLLAWLQRYGRCLPAHGDELPLCDHARLTSAIAACLAYAGADARLCLIGGALASTPGGQRQPVQLCGRGLYLAALADSFAYQLADRLGLPCGNVIMAAGRRWYVLAPAGPATAAAVAELRTELDVWLHHELAGAVTLGLAQAEFALEQLWPGSAEQAGFGALVGGLNHALEAQLLAGARGALAAADGWDEAAFVLRAHSFAGRRPCTECGRLPAGAEAGMCPACARDMALGGQLAQLGYLAHYRPDAAAGGIAAGRGWAFRALAAADLASAGVPYLVLKLNDPRIAELAGLPGGYKPLALYTPPDGDAEPGLAATRARARPLLGSLRVNVDHAGALLAHGLGRAAGGHDGAVQIAALSRELDLFFASWLRHTLAKPAYQNFSTLDADGDNLLIIGPWGQAAPLALEIRAQFSRFVGHHPDITLSAGVLIAQPTYPLARAACDAGRQLDQAKAQRWGTPARTGDHLSMLGDTVHWSIAPLIFNEISTLHKHSGLLTGSLLRDLIEYGNLYRLWRDEQRVEGLRYKAMFAYNIARTLRRGDAEIYRWADELIQSLHGRVDSLAIRHLGLIATYSLLMRRSDQ